MGVGHARDGTDGGGRKCRGGGLNAESRGLFERAREAVAKVPAAERSTDDVQLEAELGKLAPR